MSVQKEVRGIVISPKRLLTAVFSNPEFSFQILIYLESSYYLFGFLRVEDLSSYPDLSRLWFKLKKTRWRIFLLEHYAETRYHKRRLFFLKCRYRRNLRALIRQMGRVVDADLKNAEAYQRWIREDSPQLFKEYGG